MFRDKNYSKRWNYFCAKKSYELPNFLWEMDPFCVFPTDSTKINRPRHNICMYWTNFCQPTNHVKQNIFEQTLIKDVGLSLYASFDTFCVQIGQLFESQWAFEECLNIDKSLFSKEMSPISVFFRMFKDSMRL